MALFMKIGYRKTKGMCKLQNCLDLWKKKISFLKLLAYLKILCRQDSTFE